ncbi:alkaline phosphatase D family protein [Sphingomonas sp. AP4-R1]|uniref:alkaline phosphatase D family protein n=1 Tax=Sphingomonas sp. AP4-R1 TaxID=2735134 RepID=UPI0014938B2F|nr:alkaline phosphatase D family protein [Sphingomonas sp. AP4-R1]QJU59328.1 alkaline phosphatase D family protein [Sphingomonas sp. AP4-R1]
MTLDIDRRTFIAGTGLALGGLLLPSRLLATSFATGFTHNVASGEPGQDSILLWTRYVAAAGDHPVSLDAEIALDPQFARIVGGGAVQTGAYRDWTAKLLIDGLKPGTTYFYRFIASDGTKSPVGRTRTLPVGRVPRFGVAVFSCSNAPVGWFNAYGHAARRTDLDLWFHVGDYIYEGGPSRPPRQMEPAYEPISLADYRLRYASYRADPDLQQLHQTAPMIALWDDHEVADNSWEGGANNHQPATEGSWDARKSAAMQVYREWMPVSDEPWKAYRIGDLATIYRTESRLLARTWHPEPDDLMAGGDPGAALKAYRDGAWAAPSGTLLGSVQESWMAHRLKADARETTWQLVGMGTNVGSVLMSEKALGWLAPNAPAAVVNAIRVAATAHSLGMPSLFDNWGGYPAARSRFLRSAQAADANLVMLTGDSHNAWAFDLAEDGRPAGVEFGGHSVTSNGLEKIFTPDAGLVARHLAAASPELRWADTSRRGYMMIDVTPAAVTGEWQFMETIKTRNATVAATHRMTVERGRKRFAA